MYSVLYTMLRDVLCTLHSTERCTLTLQSTLSSPASAMGRTAHCWVYKAAQSVSSLTDNQRTVVQQQYGKGRLTQADVE